MIPRNPPAFPRPISTDAIPPDAHHHGDYVEFSQPQDGMTLRDYFAAKAMAAELISSHMLPEATEAFIEAQTEAGRTVEEHLAFNAYRIADAMLAERENAVRPLGVSAHVIAAAPDLLAACNEAFELLDLIDDNVGLLQNIGPEGVAAWKSLSAAIAKAEGGAS